MYKVKTYNTIAPIGLNQFPKEQYDISPSFEHPDIILVRSHNLNETIIPSSVRAIGRAGTGLNNVPVAALTQRGIPVFNTPGANANAVRELVIAGMFLSSRNIFKAWDYIHHLNEDPENLHHKIEENKKKFVGSELMGKTVGIVGLGNIGVRVANTMIDLGMNVIGYDPKITINNAWKLSSQVKQIHHLESLFSKSDFVSFHVPLIEATKGMVGEGLFKSMKKNMTLLNFARDGIIDKNALLQALNAKIVSSYVTDFPCSELKNHPQVISLPHLGASTIEAEENCAVMIVNQIRGFLENGSIENSVNFPDVKAPTLSGQDTRLAIVNSNVPNMVAQISAKIAEAGFNITSLINQSLHDIAYTLIDINKDISDAVLKNIASVEGVIQLQRLQK